MHSWDKPKLCTEVLMQRRVEPRKCLQTTPGSSDRPQDLSISREPAVLDKLIPVMNFFHNSLAGSRSAGNQCQDPTVSSVHYSFLSARISKPWFGSDPFCASLSSCCHSTECSVGSSWSGDGHSEIPDLYGCHGGVHCVAIGHSAYRLFGLAPPARGLWAPWMSH